MQTKQQAAAGELPLVNGIVPPGIYQNIPSDQYHGAPGISSSQVKLISEKSLAHFHAKYVTGEIQDKPSAAMKLGTLFHTAVLEPATIDDLYRLELDPADHPNALRGKDAIVARIKQINEDIEDKSQKLKVTGTIAELTSRLLEVDPEAVLWDRLLAAAAEDPREVVSIADWDTAHRMCESVMRHPLANNLLTGGEAESSIFAVEPNTGLPVKVRPDYLRRQDRMMVDLKSTRDASPFRWAKDAGLRGYHIQQAMYCHVPTLLEPALPIDDFVFVICENTPPM
ncbi:PD-(D/E)XK nuclease-like domain-containing protein [Endozoicomonas sp. ALB091]|uniref:PD-(D/E)XK nuclease-like domain-containing protein n=1 Tax=Endozoicomonas sp. ALB091 TaxID=3403073 RepID=UPI003BB6E35C